MELDLTDDERAFRDEVRAFLKQELTPEIWARHRDFDEYGVWSPDYTREFRRKLGAKGYIGIGWPQEYGGGGRSRIHQMILWDEIEYHRGPAVDRSVTYVPNALQAFGSAAQKAEFLPQMSRGELAWFVGYSEPEAGSDLANIKVRATEDGDFYTITGQKSYSSDSHLADYGLVIARTDPASVKHRGLTLFIVDMKTPGITITKYPTLAGWTHHAVYFDNVRVPKARIVGEPNEAWKVLMGAIDFERAALSSTGLVEREMDRLYAWCLNEREGAGRLIDDPVVRDQLVEAAIEAEGTRLMTYWLASLHDHGLRPQHESSLAVLVKRETVRKIDALTMDLLGAHAPLQTGSAWAPGDGEAESDYRDHLYFQFAAGGFDITRNVIATRGLGLPR
jgi:alkylation response protein AidB-like acyl-CoA dehydrogenase